MRMFVALALSAGLMAVPASIAQQKSGGRAPHGQPQPAQPGKIKIATFKFSGTVAEIVDGAIRISPVRAHGKRSRVALAGAVTFTAKLDAKTRITRSGVAMQTLGTVTVGDRVVVEIRAPRGTALADMPSAKRVTLTCATVVEAAPAPAPTPVPVVPPPPAQSTAGAPPPPPVIAFV